MWDAPFGASSGDFVAPPPFVPAVATECTWLHDFDGAVPLMFLPTSPWMMRLPPV